MKKLKLSIAVITLFSISGCCAIITGSTQDIPVTSYPKGATITTNRGTSVTTPDTLFLKRKNQYTLTAELPGYKTQTVKLKRNLNNWLWADLLWDFGIITWPIDFISGSAYDFSPKSLHFDLRPSVVITPDGQEHKITGYRAIIDSKTGAPVTWPVYEDEK